jgi:AhpD family alkylhydroperoxidase
MNKQRIGFEEFPTDISQSLLKIEIAVKKSGIDIKLLELMKLRASQINGCAYCIDMHFKEARHHGETDLRLYSVGVWRECPFYTEKEKSALLFTEALTNVSQNDISDEIFAELEKYFSKAEITLLTMASCQINTWNRINIAIKTLPGNYVVGRY